MQDYTQFPPIESFKKVLITIPQSALIFAHIWKQKIMSNNSSFKKSEIKKKFLTTPTLFRNHLLALSRLSILTFEETTHFFTVDFYELPEK